MRLALRAALVLALPASVQRGPAAYTVATGYATEFGAGGVHPEARLRYPLGPNVDIEPMASWTMELPYTVVDDVPVNPGEGFCQHRGGAGCAWRTGADQAFGVGTAVAYRVEGASLPLGLDGAHAGVFGQVLLPLWQSEGHRLGAEAGVETRLGGRACLGADVQVSRFTEFADTRRLSVSPLVRLAVGR